MAEVYTEAMARAESADIETAEPPSTDVGKFIFSVLTLRAYLVAEKLNSGSFFCYWRLFSAAVCASFVSVAGVLRYFYSTIRKNRCVSSIEASTYYTLLWQLLE